MGDPMTGQGTYGTPYRVVSLSVPPMSGDKWGHVHPMSPDVPIFHGGTP